MKWNKTMRREGNERSQIGGVGVFIDCDVTSSCGVQVSGASGVTDDNRACQQDGGQ